MMADGARMASLSSVLDVANLTVAYDRASPVVSGFDLRIGPGEFVGLLGDSGCGKSTAAYAMLGLARPPGRILGGTVFQGQDLLAMPDARKRQIRGKHIGLIVQKPRGALNPMLQVGRQIGNVWRAHNPATARRAEEHAIDCRCPHAMPRCANEPQMLKADREGRMLRCWRALAGELGAADALVAQHA